MTTVGCIPYGNLRVFCAQFQIETLCVLIGLVDQQIQTLTRTLLFAYGGNFYKQLGTNAAAMV